MTEPRNHNADYLTAGISPDKVNLMNLTAVAGEIYEFIGNGVYRLQEASDGKITALEGEMQTVADARSLASALTGGDPDHYTTSDWNGEPLARHLLKTQDASIFTYANPADPASVVANYLAWLFGGAINLMNEDVEASDFDDPMTTHIRNGAKALLGLPVL